MQSVDGSHARWKEVDIVRGRASGRCQWATIDDLDDSVLKGEVSGLRRFPLGSNLRSRCRLYLFERPDVSQGLLRLAC